MARLHRELERGCGRLFAAARRELDGLPDDAREGKPPRSLLNHREGLSVFLDRPDVPMDDNFSERMLRGAAIGRRSLRLRQRGRSPVHGNDVTVGTLALNGVDVLRWLTAWLAAMRAGRLSPWLPWSMDAERRNELMAPG